MKIFSSILLVASLFLLTITMANGQCYPIFYDAGIAAFNKLDFEEAINQFNAAKICDDRPADLDSTNIWIQRSQQGYIEAIIKARDLAESERLRADTARIIAQTSQLALLSGNAQATEKDTNAIILAYAAKSLSQNLVPDITETTFGQAAFNFYYKTLVPPQTPIFNLLQIPNSNDIILETGQGYIHKLNAEHLSPRQVVELISIGKHNDYITNISFHPDHERGLSISSSMDQSAILWKQGQYLHQLKGHQARVIHSAISKDGNLALTCSEDSTAKIWKTTGQLLHTLSGHQRAIYDGQFVDDNKIITRSADQTIGLWDTNGKLIKFIQSDQGAYFYDFKYVNKQQRFITLNALGSLEFWDLEGNLLNTLSSTKAPIRDFQLTSTGEILTVGALPVLSIWDMEGQLIEELPIPQLDQIDFFKYDPLRNKTILAASNGTVLLNNDDKTTHFLSAESIPIEATFAPTSDLLLITYKNGKARLWSKSGLLLFEIALETKQPIPAIFANEGNYIVASVKKNSEILYAPIPEVAWRQLKAAASFLEKKLEQLEIETGIDIGTLK